MIDEITTSVVMDARLTPDAVRLVLYVAALGDGPHEVSYTQFSILLNHQGGDRRVRRALSLAVELGWLERTPGGRGHSDSYSAPDRVPEFRNPKDRVHKNGNPKKDSLPSNVQPKTDRVPEFGKAKDPVGGTVGGEQLEEEAVAVAGEKNAGAPEATDVPKYKLSERAAKVLSDRGDDLNGCRGALRDYLRARVKPERQYGYAQTVVTWIDGGDWSVFRLPEGKRAETERIPKILGAAINELLAADEAMMKRPVGDPGNLKTKISILCKQRGDHDRGSGGRSGKPQKSGGTKPNPIRGDPSRRRRGPA